MGETIETIFFRISKQIILEYMENTEFASKSANKGVQGIGRDKDLSNVKQERITLKKEQLRLLPCKTFKTKDGKNLKPDDEKNFNQLQDCVQTLKRIGEKDAGNFGCHNNGQLGCNMPKAQDFILAFKTILIEENMLNVVYNKHDPLSVFMYYAADYYAGQIVTKINSVSSVWNLWGALGKINDISNIKSDKISVGIETTRNEIENIKEGSDDVIYQVVVKAIISLLSENNALCQNKSYCVETGGVGIKPPVDIKVSQSQLLSPSTGKLEEKMLLALAQLDRMACNEKYSKDIRKYIKLRLKSGFKSEASREYLATIEKRKLLLEAREEVDAFLAPHKKLAEELARKSEEVITSDLESSKQDSTTAQQDSNSDKMKIDNEKENKQDKKNQQKASFLDQKTRQHMNSDEFESDYESDRASMGSP